jgi:hypothetical protein
MFSWISNCWFFVTLVCLILKHKINLVEVWPFLSELEQQIKSTPVWCCCFVVCLITLGVMLGCFKTTNQINHGVVVCFFADNNTTLMPS